MLKHLAYYIIGICIISTVLLCDRALASPLCPVPLEVTQPDGTTITVRTYGDEFFSWKEDEDGNIVAYDEETNSYKYAKIKDGRIVPTSQTAGDKSLSGLFSRKIKREDIEPLWESANRVDYSAMDNNIGLMSADDAADKQPLTHEKLLLILIEFNDVPIEFGSEYWHDSMFSTNPNALSVVNYYKENSGGLDVFEPANTTGVQDGRTGTASYKDYVNIGYTITKCPEGVVKVSLDMPHPIKTWVSIDETETGKTVNLAVQAIEQDFDFKSEKPHIVAMFAGYETTVGAGDGKGQVGAYASFGGIGTSSGVILGRYAVVGEKLRETEPTGIGSICHELGHTVFGLPDLYPKRVPSLIGDRESIVFYSLMSLGSFGRRYDPTTPNSEYDDPYADKLGHVPTHLDPWSKIKLGYITPDIIVDDWDGDVHSISELGVDSAYNVLEIRSKADPKQYFLVENRQLIGYDKGLEEMNGMFAGKSFFDGGIVIYHVDENVNADSNNNSAQHGFIQVERSTNEDDVPGWHYLNIAGRNKFNAETEPNSNFHEFAGFNNCSIWENCHPQTIKSGISVEILSENNSSMRVTAKVDDEYIIPQADCKFSDMFPDENFCRAVIDFLEKEDASGRTPDSTISEKDWIKITSADTIDLDNRGIKDLSGLEYFLSITNLGIYGNELTELIMPECQKLYLINCEDNQLKKIDVSKCENLIYFYCSNNKLTELDLSNNKILAELECENNLLTSLDTKNNYYLHTVCCSNNRLTALDFSNNPRLWVLRCYDNCMDNDPYNSIIGLEAVEEELGEPTSKDNEGKGWFVYYPQNPVPTPTPTATPTAAPTAEPKPTPSPTPTVSPVVYPYKILNVALKSQSGSDLTSAPLGESFIVDMELLKTEKRDEKDCLFIAVYGTDGALLSLDYVRANFADNYTYSFGFNIQPQSEPIGEIRAFVWNSFNSLEPLAESVKLIQ